ncbi:hypothetical protein V8C42DRAFT_320239 [Trichoderma barbatum]
MQAAITSMLQSCIYQVMQKNKTLAHDMWLDMLKAALACGSSADLAASPAPCQDNRAAKVHGQHPRRGSAAEYAMLDSASHLTYTKQNKALKRASPLLLLMSVSMDKWMDGKKQDGPKHRAYLSPPKLQAS